jgi:hypothetical protein
MATGTPASIASRTAAGDERRHLLGRDLGVVRPRALCDGSGRRDLDPVGAGPGHTAYHGARPVGAVKHRVGHSRVAEQVDRSDPRRPVIADAAGGGDLPEADEHLRPVDPAAFDGVPQPRLGAPRVPDRRHAQPQQRRQHGNGRQHPRRPGGLQELAAGELVGQGHVRVAVDEPRDDETAAAVDAVDPCCHTITRTSSMDDMADDLRFRNANRFAGVQGYAGGFPNFHETDHGHGVVYGTYLFTHAAVEWRDVARGELVVHDPGVVHMEDVAAVVRAVNRWAGARGFAAGFPTFEQAMTSNGAVLGALLLRPGHSQWQDVRRADLGDVGIGDVPALMRAANDWARAQGFAAGYPTFEQADHGQGVVAGVTLLNASAVAWRDVFADVLAMQSRYSFDPGLTGGQVARLLERYAFAYERLAVCQSLSDKERNDTRTAFRRNIRTGITADPGVNASAAIGGRSIDVNVTNHFGNSAREQAQTLVHEMVHCAGYGHPDRRDCPPGVTPNCDVPFDNGRYYGTAPLRAELCVGGFQSDTLCAPVGETATVLKAVTPRIDLVRVTAGPDADHEYVRIVHDGDTAVNLRDWTVTDTADRSFTFPDLTILPNQAITLWTGTGPADHRNQYWGRADPVWGKDASRAQLVDGSGAVRSTYAYGTS